MTRKRTYTGLVGPLRDKLEAVIAEYREWASVYLIGDEEEELGELFEGLILSGKIAPTRTAILFMHHNVWRFTSPGITKAATAHAIYIAAAWKALNRAERLALTNPRLVKVG